MTESEYISEAAPMAEDMADERRPRRWPVWLCRLLLIALVLGHFWFLSAYFEPAISTPDANGYFAQACRIATEGRTWFEPDTLLQYVGVHWLKTDDDRHFSRYPPGLPMLLAVPFRLAGPEASLWVNPVLATLTLVGLYLLCREWIGEGWGLAAVAAMAVNPVANTRALAHDAHTAAAFFLVWGVYLLARWSKSMSPAMAFLAGLCLGIIPTVRYPEALFGLGVGLFMLLHLRWERKVWISLAAGVGGALIPIGLLMLRNHLAFGAFWRTGYALTNEQTGFGWNYFRRYAVSYIENIQGDGAGLLTALGLTGLAAICIRRDTWRQGLLLLTLIVPTTLLYMSYYWAPQRMTDATMRFLLPTFFIYAVAGLWCLKLLAESRLAGACAAAVVLVAVKACWGVPRSIETLSKFRETNAALSKVTDAVTEHVPAGSVLFANPQVQQHLDFVGRWRLGDESILQGRGARPGRGRREQDPDAPSPRQADKTKAIEERYGSLWSRRLPALMLKDLEEWAAPQGKVYWLGAHRQMQRLVPLSHRLKVVATIKLPRIDDKTSRQRGRPDFPPGPPGGNRPGGPPGGPFGGPPMGGRGPGRFGRMPRGGGPMGRMQFLLSGEPLTLAEWTFSAARQPKP